MASWRPNRGHRRLNVAAPPESNTGESGFTLVELLVALTLLAMLSALLVGGLRFGTRAWERTDDHLDQANTMQLVQGFLRNRLGEAVPAVDQEASGNRRAARSSAGPPVVFDGERGSLGFITRMPVHLGVGGFVALDLFLDPGAGDLVLRWRPYRFGAEDDDEGEPDERVLLSGVSRLKLSYFGRRDEDEAPRWRNEWRDARRLPSLIRLELTFRDADRQAWPELVVAPAVNTPPRRRR